MVRFAVLVYRFPFLRHRPAICRIDPVDRLGTGLCSKTSSFIKRSASTNWHLIAIMPRSHLPERGLYSSRSTGLLVLQRPYSSKCVGMCSAFLRVQGPNQYVPLQYPCFHCHQNTSSNETCISAVATISKQLCTGYPIESRSREVKTAAIACAALAFPIVALRCVARWMVTKKLWLDDWTAVMATVRSILRYSDIRI